MVKCILFDLDGTLTDSEEGIIRSIQYALASFGIDEKAENLKEFLGPPAHIAYQKYYGFSEEQAALAVEKYRERFSVTGIYENRLYNGIPELLEKLTQDGKVLAIATSKPLVYTEIILKHFGIEHYFTEVVGSTMDGSFCDKSEIVAEALRRCGVDKSECIMVGDRRYDVIGAKDNGIKSIGALYGYGSREELSEAGADFIVENVGDIYDIVK